MKLPVDAPLAVSTAITPATGAGAQRPQGEQAIAVVPGDWPAPSWWKHYEDPVLDRLIDMALKSSPTLATAHARVDSAEQLVRIAGAAAGAHVDASGDTSRQRLSDNGLFPPQLLGFHWYNLSDLGLQVSYTFDWWGKQRDAVESALDEAHAAEADRTAAALVLASAVADTYFGWQSDQNRLNLAQEREAAVVREGRIVAARIRAELESADEAQRADSNIAAVREQMAELQGSASLRIVALAALVGCAPDQLPAMTVKPLPAISDGLPEDVKIDLIARRADLTASRWRVEAAQKKRDAARAEFFPDVSINALIGLQSVDLGKLLEYRSRVPSATAAIHLPIFDGGRLQAGYRSSQAAIDEAVAGYQDTLVGAARDVATQATSRARIAAQRTQRLIEVAAAERLKFSAEARVRQGVTDSRMLLAATESWIEQRDALLQLDSAAVSSDIGLQRALGGGYLRNEKQQ
ncbi:MAG TPA: efflux transporter outer membrane subunit [Steroidobacteraceae bacterium]|nr:efflux transporter outer membrane subunit [Steroidobacteraceae bacterium]